MTNLNNCKLLIIILIKFYTVALHSQTLKSEELDELGSKSFINGNCTVALEYYLNAKKAGSQVADHNIGMVYTNCKSMKKDVEQAIIYFKNSAINSKDSSVQSASSSQLGEIYFREYNDTLKALDWYRHSIKGNLASSYYDFGIFLFYDMKEIKLRKEGFDMILTAAEKGYNPAMEQLARIYQVGRFGVKKNNILAYEWAKKAQTLNAKCCHAILGKIYQDGLYGKPDLDQALNYFRKGEELNDGESLYYLGNFPTFQESKQTEYLIMSARLGFDFAKDTLKIRKIQW